MCEHVAIPLKTYHSINMIYKMTFENANAMVYEYNDHTSETIAVVFKGHMLNNLISVWV